MLNFILSLFKTKISNKPVKQTGLIVEPPKPGEWIGDETGIVAAVRMPSADWTPLTPTGEKQYAILGFDSLSCSTFSALNVVEMLMTYYMASLSQDHKDFLRLFNFIDENGKFNASDNFSAVMSGTTRNGNTLPNVWESFRTQGIVSEKDYPFGDKSFDYFHDKSRISEYMKRRAKKFLDFFTVQYQWQHFTTTGRENTAADIQAMRDGLKEAPLHIGIVIPATHAESLLMYKDGYKTFFDSYEPYIKNFEDIYNPIHFSMKGLIIPKTVVPKFPAPSFKFNNRLALGMTNSEVLAYQKILNYMGFMNVATGYFGPVTVAATKEFQAFYGLQQAGEVGPKTREVLNSFYSAPEAPAKTNGQILYETARGCLNIDVTPNDYVNDEVACAESVNAVYKKAFGKEIGGGPSTNAMYKVLLSHPDFSRVTTPEAGDVVISPTGYGTGGLSNGHVGIVGTNGAIMSNSSGTGKFSQNFTMETWRARYVGLGGFPMAFFRRK